MVCPEDGVPGFGAVVGAGEDAAVEAGGTAKAQESATRTQSGGKFIGILSELYKQREALMGVW